MFHMASVDSHSLKMKKGSEIWPGQERVYYVSDALVKRATSVQVKEVPHADCPTPRRLTAEALPFCCMSSHTPMNFRGAKRSLVQALQFTPSGPQYSLSYVQPLLLFALLASVPTIICKSQ